MQRIGPIVMIATLAATACGSSAATGRADAAKHDGDATGGSDAARDVGTKRDAPRGAPDAARDCAAPLRDAPATGDVMAMDGSSRDALAAPESGDAPSKATACSAAQTGANADFKGYRLFPADHPLNTAVDTMAVNAQSATWLSHCSAGAPHLQIDLSMPYNIVPANTPPVTATALQYNSTPYPNPWPFPASAVIEGGDPTSPGDHHCLAFDVGNCKLYEVYNILWAADHSTFTAASGTVWDTTIDDPGNGSGSDAAGLPITPLVIRYDELVTLGAIHHALRFTCASSEMGHIAPARTSASSSTGSGVPADPHDPTYPPMGMRVRLKASFDPVAAGFPAPLVVLANAIKKYGLILADNGGAGSPLFITGATDTPLYNTLIGPAYMLKSITTADLEVVDTGPVVQD